MITRYSHPAITELWSDEWTYQTWLEIETAALTAQIVEGILPEKEATALLGWLSSCHINTESAGKIRAIERRTNHDVAAFLEYIRTGAPGNGKLIHFGLTSSDLVDTAMSLRFKHAGRVLNLAMADLVSALGIWTQDTTPVVGMTHGQPAEPTFIRARALHWLATLEPTIRALLQQTQAMRRAKLSGPVGTFAHNPPAVEERAADLLGLAPMGIGASQVIPRSTLALWAQAVSVFAAGCAKIATDLRLMNLMREVEEPQEPGEIGSSSMAHKRNPIRAERICGLARVMQGYAGMLTPLDLWLERDISSSSVERIAVPDLWHLLLFIAQETTLLLASMQVNVQIADIHIDDESNSLFVSKITNDELLDTAETIEEARNYAVNFDYESYDMANYPRYIISAGSEIIDLMAQLGHPLDEWQAWIIDVMGDATWHTRNYPKGRKDAGKRGSQGA